MHLICEMQIRGKSNGWKLQQQSRRGEAKGGIPVTWAAAGTSVRQEGSNEGESVREKERNHRRVRTMLPMTRKDVASKTGLHTMMKD